MALEDILRALEEKASSQIEVIQSESQQRVAEIKAEVEKDAARMRRQRLKKAEDAAHSEASAIVYSATLKAKNELIKAQEDTVDEAFKMAEKRLAELHQEADYPTILETLLDEALEYFEGEVILEVRVEDRPLVEGMMTDRNRQFRISDTPLQASGGIVVSSPDGVVVVSNTFESRLERARDKLRLAISNTLFKAQQDN